MKQAVTMAMAMASLLCVAMSASLAFDRLALEVIYTGPNTEPARPFFARIERKRQGLNRKLNRAHDRALDRAKSRLAMRHGPMTNVGPNTFFPVVSGRLKPGKPQVTRVARLSQPVFVIGMDHRSLRWLQRHLMALQRLKAKGVVVQADHYPSFALLRDRLATLGMELSVLSGESLAIGYPIRTYPTLLIGAQHGR